MIKIATVEDVQVFKQVFKTRFVLEDDMNDIDLQLLTLQQTAFENMDAYYQRTETLLTIVLLESNAVDSARTISKDLEQSCLKRVIKNFIRGIRDSNLQQEALTYGRQRITKGDGYSLHAIYRHIENHSPPKSAAITTLPLHPFNQTN